MQRPPYRPPRDDPWAYGYRGRGYYHRSPDDRSAYGYRGDPWARGYPRQYHPSRDDPSTYGYHPSRGDPYAYGYPRQYHPSQYDPQVRGFRPPFRVQGLDSNGSRRLRSTDDGHEEDTEELGDGKAEAADNRLLNPPPYGYPDDDGNIPRPEFVLIEPYAYFADRANATTACCETSRLGARGTLKVTFCAARPPLVSYLCVHATALDHTKFAVQPHIVATEADGGLVLLRVVVGDRGISSTHQRHYFVYDARGPSLRHLPRHHGQPGSGEFRDHSFAIVRRCGSRCGQGDHDCGDYVIAAHRGFRYAHSSVLYLYHSDTNTWSERQPVLLKNYPTHSHVTSKTIAIGGDGGTVAWVDLSHDILFCNVLEECPKLRAVPLPWQSDYLDRSRPDTKPRSVRDVAFVDGFVKYFEMESRVEMDNGRTMYSWNAIIWSIKTSRKSRWHKDYELQSSDLCEQLQITPQPTLLTLHISLPSLSLQDDGVVYFLAYRDKDHTTTVIAVDMRNKTVEKMDESFSSWRKNDLARGYDASRISKYLKAAPV